MSEGSLPSYLVPDDEQKAKGTTPLHIAVGLFRVSNDARSAEQLMMEALEATGDVNSCDRNGNTALHSAALIQMTGAVEFLLEAGAEVDALNNNGETPLFRCVSQTPRKEIVDLLLNAGADPYIKGRYNQSIPEYIKEIPTRERVDAFRQYFTDEEIAVMEQEIAEKEILAEEILSKMKF